MVSARRGVVHELAGDDRAELGDEQGLEAPVQQFSVLNTLKLNCRARSIIPEVQQRRWCSRMSRQPGGSGRVRTRPQRSRASRGAGVRRQRVSYQSELKINVVKNLTSTLRRFHSSPSGERWLTARPNNSTVLSASAHASLLSLLPCHQNNH